jgi:hypothetical protein
MSLLQLAILLTVALVLILALLAWFVGTRRAPSKELPAEVRDLVKDARVDAYEHPSSLVAEQIEEMVRHKLEGYPDLADTVFDFGTMPDGSFDVWVNQRQYGNIESIEDARIRKAIQEAVDEFNK